MGFLGGLFGGGDQKQKTSSTTSIPSYYVPLSKQIATSGQNIGNQPYQAYTGQRVAGINPAMRTALTNIGNQGGNRLLNQSKSYTSDVLSGKYLNSNPYLQDIINTSNRDASKTYMQSVAPEMQANLARRGAFGGSQWDQANTDIEKTLAQALADSNAQTRYADYNTQQGRMDQAVGNAMNLNSADLANLDAALKGGQIEQQNTQQGLDTQYGDYTEQRDWQLRNLQAMLQAMGGTGKQDTTDTTTKGSGGGGGLLGNIVGAAGIGKGFGLF